VLLDGDIDVIDGGWLREMVSLALRPDVGAVGARLLHPDDTLRHAGLVLGFGDGPGIAGCLGQAAGRNDNGYFGHFALTREVSAVTGACLAIRKATLEALGGFEEGQLPEAYGDVDLCLRLWSRGLRVLWTPFAELYRLGPAQEDAASERAAEAALMRARWGDALTADPFYNPAFSRHGQPFQLADAPPACRPWRASRG
jgi:GT2 family glycosyltransferase